VAAASLAAPALADDPQYVLFNLREFSPGDDNVIALGMNNKGQVVGFAQQTDESSPFEAFVWLPFDDGDYVDDTGSSPLAAGLWSLDVLAPPPATPALGGVAGDGTVAIDLNDAGIVVGRYWNQDPDGDGMDPGNDDDAIDNGAIWDLTIASPPGDIDTSTLAGRGHAFSVNDDSAPRIVGGLGELYEASFTEPFNAPRASTAFLYDGSSVIDLKASSSIVDPVAYAISDTIATTHRVAGGEACPTDDMQCASGSCLLAYEGLHWDTPNSSTDPGLLSAQTFLGDTVYVVGHGVNDDQQVAGFGWNPANDDTLCTQEAYFWADPDNQLQLPVKLPEHTDPMNEDVFSQYAYDIRNELGDGTIEIVGSNTGLGEAMLWRGVPDGMGGYNWTFVDLNDAPDVVLNLLDFNDLRAATAINDDGWIAVWGQTESDEFRSGVLVPWDNYQQFCGADLVGPQEVGPDGVVNVFDLLELLGEWGESNSPADIDGPAGAPDGTVDVFDMLKLLAQWGPCVGVPDTEVLSLEDEVLAAGLTMDDWDEFEDVMTSGTETQQAQYNCWMRRYISGCVVCPACKGPDPFD